MAPVGEPNFLGVIHVPDFLGFAYVPNLLGKARVPDDMRFEGLSLTGWSESYFSGPSSRPCGGILDSPSWDKGAHLPPPPPPIEDEDEDKDKDDTCCCGGPEYYDKVIDDGGSEEDEFKGGDTVVGVDGQAKSHRDQTVIDIQNYTSRFYERFRGCFGKINLDVPEPLWKVNVGFPSSFPLPLIGKHRFYATLHRRIGYFAALAIFEYSGRMRQHMKNAGTLWSFIDPVCNQLHTSLMALDHRTAVSSRLRKHRLHISMMMLRSPPPKFHPLVPSAVQSIRAAIAFFQRTTGVDLGFVRCQSVKLLEKWGISKALYFYITFIAEAKDEIDNFYCDTKVRHGGVIKVLSFTRRSKEGVYKKDKPYVDLNITQRNRHSSTGVWRLQSRYTIFTCCCRVVVCLLQKLLWLIISWPWAKMLSTSDSRRVGVLQNLYLSVPLLFFMMMRLKQHRNLCSLQCEKMERTPTRWSPFSYAQALGSFPMSRRVI